MSSVTKDPKRALPKAPQPPLSYPGATPDSDRAKRPALAEPSATGQELDAGDRVEGLGIFGKPTGSCETLADRPIIVHCDFVGVKEHAVNPKRSVARVLDEERGRKWLT